jgi:hypothetical protein
VLHLSRRLRLSASLSTLVFCCACTVSAQTASTGALSVTVKDPSGAVVPAANVTISNAAGLTRSIATNNDGSSTFSLLQPGEYRVHISAAGFATADVTAAVHVTETEAITQNLRVGDQTQQVEVTGDIQTIQTETATLGGVIGSSSIIALPLVTRNFTQILNLSPGVVTDVTNAAAAGRGALQNIYVNGKDNTGNSYQMDGIGISNYAIGAPTDAIGYYGNIPIPSPDALQEFKVQTSLYDSSYGRNSGASVNVITKSGSNDIHGALFEFLRNDKLNANTFFLNRTGQPRGVLKQNQFGGVLGGPLKKDKLFLFVSYQGTRQVNGVAGAATSSVNLPEQLTDDRSLLTLENQFCANNPANAVASGSTKAGPGAPYSHTFQGGQQIACPGGGTPGAGTTPIPLDTPGGINSVAFRLLNAKLPGGGYVIPTPQVLQATSSGGLVGLSSFSVPATFNEDQAMGNLDYLLSHKHTIALKYYYSYGALVSPFTAAGQPPNGGNRGLSGNMIIAGKVTSIVSASMVNEARFSSYYIRSSLNSLVPVSVQSVGLTPSNPTSSLMPVMTITGLFSNFGSATDGTKTPQTSYEYSDQLSINRGRHTLKMGYNQQYVMWDICSCGKIRGSITFQTFADFLVGQSAAQNGTAFSNVFASSASMQLWSTPNFLRENQASAFFQDDFKVSPKLTLNLGVRWEYDGTAYDLLERGGTNYVYGLAAAVPIPSAFGTYAGFTVKKDYQGPLPAGIIRRDTEVLTNGSAPWHNFAPRVGFAWQPFGNTGKFVVRGGSGWFYDVVFGNAWLQTLNTTPPNAAVLSYSGATNAAATFAVPFNPPIAPGSFDGFVRTPTSALTQRGVDPNIVTPVTMNWNVNLQYAVTPSWTAEVGYVGSRGLRIVSPQFYNIPQLASPSNPINCGGPSGCITTNTSANAAQRVPVLGLTPGGAQMASNIGDSNYNSIQAVVRRRTRTTQFQAAYTYGRSFSDLVGAAIGGGVGLATNSNDPANRAQQYGPSDFNRPQRLVINYLWAIPDFNRNHSLLGRSLSGWNLSGVTTIQSGTALTITDSRGGLVFGSVGASRAQMCPGATYDDILTSGSTTSRLNGYFNSSAFCAVPVTGQVNGAGGATGYGNTGRGIVTGPGQHNWDFALSKKTTVGGLREGAYIEFRSEFFNAFNHPQFSNPAANVAAATFGVITTTSVGPRIIQFALRYAF